ncbi:MAG TPA: EamA family transporter [Bryobacteraceae bacterium]|nr:EamA family transporter [Bryobacteraceae bacterium]
MYVWFWLSLITLLLFGITGVTQKLSTNHISFEMSFVWFGVAMCALSALVVVFVPLPWRELTGGLVALAAAGGLLNGLGVLTSFAALKQGGKASVVIPIINLYPLVTIAGAWLFLGEKVSGRQIVGIALALAAVVLLSQEGS